MWSKKYDKCIVCGTIERKHVGKGMCTRCYETKWRKENPEKVKRKEKKYYKKNSEKCKARNKEWYRKHPEKNKEYQKKYYKLNPEIFKERTKRYRKLNLEKCKVKQKEYYSRDCEKRKKQKKEQYYADPEKYRARSREYKKKYRKEISKKSLESYHNNPRLKLKCVISRSINKKLHFRLLSKNGKKTWDFLPYTVDKLKQHLESLFKPWMNWDNWGAGEGKWNIDHIIPDSSFNYSSVDDKEFQECWALENLQPLDAIENMKKGNKIIS